MQYLLASPESRRHIPTNHPSFDKFRFRCHPFPHTWHKHTEPRPFHRMSVASTENCPHNTNIDIAARMDCKSPRRCQDQEYTAHSSIPLRSCTMSTTPD